jgi:uncharacterized membrane protein YkvA (DUF1232 family)
MADRLSQLKIAARALNKAKGSSQSLEGLFADVNALARMVAAWARREYNVVPWRAIAMATGALVYFVNPFDAVPDALLGVGYLDDASVVAFVAGALKSDLDRFVAWERGSSSSALA